MKQQYERTTLSITRFDDSDVITTSYVLDKNNSYRSLSELNDSGDRLAPNR